jgi:hypothetical protein
MPGNPRSPVPLSVRLPAGVLGRDYLKFLQLSAADEVFAEEPLDDAAFEEAMTAIGWVNARGAASDDGLL